MALQIRNPELDNPCPMTPSQKHNCRPSTAEPNPAHLGGGGEAMQNVHALGQSPTQKRG